MKIIKVIGSIVVMILLVIVFAIYLLPSTAHMERSIVVKATPTEVYRELITFRTFNTWSPWAEKDPEAAYIYEGPDYGPGARITWKSENPDLGDGSMEIVAADSNRMVRSILSFDEYESTPYGTFYLEEAPGGTRVTWAYDENNVSGFGKIFMLGIDGFLGRDWESALARLKERVESAPRFETHISVATVTAYPYVGISDTALNDPALVSTKMARNHGELMSFFTQHQLEPAGYPITVFTSPEEEMLSFICGLPVSPTFTDHGAYSLYESYNGLVIRSVHLGSYDDLEKAHEEIRDYAFWYNYEIHGNPWEEYVTDPEKESDSLRWETRIYYPVR